MESVVRRNEHLLGASLVVASALVFSLSGVLTKAIAAEAWTIVCWRGWLLSSVGSLASLAFIFAFRMTYVGLWCSDRKIDASWALISTLMPSWLGSGQIPGVHMPACG
jgi:hypothetical protein